MSETKNLRAPRARAGQLKAKWGRIEGDSPDFCYVWGPGVARADAALLHGALSMRQCMPLSMNFEPSFMEDLKARGYDISTLEISVCKKPEHVQADEPGCAMSTIEALGAASEENARLRYELAQEKESYDSMMSALEEADAQISRMKKELDAARPSRDAMLAELEHKLGVEAEARQQAEAEVERLAAELGEVQGMRP